ncbi:hypothetical protein MO973_24955 [Paenibacillus sp. TRM 82003]|nr:hypothetical protein [Paenibacillus sp. TRM 82003]MCI3923482.1 hypothetical protein [Paenibacillus sp. TRM 82003]
MKSNHEIERAICIMLLVIAGFAFAGTFVWPVLSELGGYFALGACLASAVMLWRESLESDPEAVHPPRTEGDENDR